MQTNEKSLMSPKTTIDFLSKQKKWWESKIEGRKLAVWWLFTSLMGILFISLTSNTLRLVIPVFLLVIYSWYGYKYVRTSRGLVALWQARVRQLADSIYFLGFLWTLYSLIDSFVFHPEISIAEAGFRAFGYALITTATGMFLRLFLLQFSYSFEEQAQSAEQNIEEEITRFIKELSGGKEGINSFRAEINSLKQSAKSLKVSVDEIKSQVTGITQELLKPYKDSLTNLEEHTKKIISETIQNLNFTELKKQLEVELPNVIKDLNEDVIKTTKSIETDGKSVSEGFEKNIDSFQKAMEHLNEQIENIHVPSDIVEKKVTQKTESVIFELTKSLKAFQNTIYNLDKSLRTSRVNSIHHKPWWKFWI